MANVRLLGTSTSNTKSYADIKLGKLFRLKAGIKNDFRMKTTNGFVDLASGRWYSSLDSADGVIYELIDEEIVLSN